MQAGRNGPKLTRLADGRVLIWGGHLEFSFDAPPPEIFDPRTRRFTSTGKPIWPFDGRKATLLADGSLLFSGGTWAGGAETWDPAAGTFRPTANTGALYRTGHTATLLNDGRVLVAGGDGTYEPGNSAECYDPRTGRFTAVAKMTTGRSGHQAHLLPDGRVLLIAGFSGRDPWEVQPMGDAATAVFAECFQPNTSTFDAVPCRGATLRAGFASLLLPTGLILITGGRSPVADRILDHAELFDPATGVSVLAGRQRQAREVHALFLLPGGQVLVYGGSDFTKGSWNLGGEWYR
jgi:hypothetical protein